MERLQLIRERQSARVFFDRNRPIPSKEMAQILEAARFAPTAHNMQNFEIVVVDDRRLLETLAAIRTSVSEAFVRENLAGSPSRRRSKTCSASTPSCASLSRAGSATRSYHQITCGSAATSRTWSTITGLVTTSSDTAGLIIITQGLAIWLGRPQLNHMSNIVVRCLACGQQNRLPASRLREQPRCGKCHHAGLLSAPIPVDEVTLAGLVKESSLPLLVDFWAPWCGPCRTVAPVLDDLASTHGGAVLFLKVNVDESQRAAAQHRVSGIPALVLFDKGQERDRLVGAHPRRNIEALLYRYPSTSV